jgi:hypothetical protein
MHEALVAGGATPDPASDGAWRLVPPDDPDLEIIVRENGDWLCLAADVAAKRTDLFSCLQWNAGLPGLAKFVVPPGRGAVRLQAEIPLDRTVDAAAHIRLAVAGICAGAAHLRGTRILKTTAEADAKPLDLRALCDAAGWACTPRSETRLAAALDVPGGFHQAIVEAVAGLGVRAAADLVEAQGLGDPSREAIARLLLRAGSAVRMVRPAAEAAGERTLFRWEAALGARPGPQELRHALAALSMACRLTAREVEVLQNPAGAEAYLSVLRRHNETDKATNR